jgi:DNA-binding CsgD family transcriptional regulator
MRDLSELFWQASIQEIKQGYQYNPSSEEFICLICGKSYRDGIIYPHNNVLYEAKKYIAIHIQEEHQSPFHTLLNLDKKLTGLTDHQKSLLELFYAGYSDNDIAKKLNTGSTSTIRNHRFTLREKQKQAKVFFAIMELLGEATPKKQTFIALPRGTQNIDDRFAITEEEQDKILHAAFQEGLNGPLTTFPLKEKKRVAIIRHLIKHFDIHRTYSEKEVNEILKRYYEDYALLRRYFIEYGFMERTPDGKRYWLKP